MWLAKDFKCITIIAYHIDVARIKLPAVCTPISEHFAKLGAPIHVRREFAPLPQTPNIPLAVPLEVPQQDELSPE